MRNNARGAAGNAANMLARATLTRADDDHKMQENAVEILKGEKKTGLERFQNYGFSSVPLKETGGTSHEAAEAIVAFIGGNRSHGVIIAVDDRRHRPKGLKEGESVLYDDQGQKIYLTRDGIVVDGGDKKKPVTVKVGNAKLIVKDGEIEATVDKLSIFIRPGRIDLGKKDAPFKVQTEGGPSAKVWAVIA